MTNDQFFIHVNHKPPCMDCSKRHMGCHDRCDSYKAFKEKLETDKQAKESYEDKMSRRRFGRRHYES